MTQKEVIHPFFSKDGKETGENSPKIPPTTAKPPQPIPSCRRVINVTFTPSQMETSSSKSIIESKVDSDTAEIEQKLRSVHLTSPPSDTVVRPPLAKQHSDVQLLMDELLTDKQNASGLVVYLLSSSWWKSWQQATASSSSSSSTSNSTNDVLPVAIDNTCLLDNKDSLAATDNDTMLMLRRDVKEGVNDGDFVCVPEAAWNALLSWYGGGPALPRLLRPTVKGKDQGVDGSLFLDLWPDVPVTTTNAKPLLRLYQQRRKQEEEDEEEDKAATDRDDDDDDDVSTSTAPVPPPSRSHSDSYLSSDSMNVFDGGVDGLSSSSSATGAADQSLLSGNKVAPSPPPPSQLSLAEISMASADCGTNVLDGPDNNEGNGAVPRSLRSICFVCKSPSNLRCTGCSSVNYCSQTCQRSHWKASHKKWCAVAAKHKDLPFRRFQEVVPVGRRGRVGLHNLGNSCYMNSSLQCLSHVFPLTRYFLTQQYQAHINETSVFGTGGKLANGYYNLLVELWFNNQSAISPMVFKKLMGRLLNAEYGGLAQQDAHEVVEQFLDKLHEDLNKVTTKPYFEKPEGDGSNDEEVADDEWRKYTSREDSEVKDIVGSLLRSRLTCLECGKKTVYFEYHQTFQLAIPTTTPAAAKPREIKVLYIPDIDIAQRAAAAAKSVKPPPSSSSSSSSAVPVLSQPLLFVVKAARNDTLGALKVKVARLISEAIVGSGLLDAWEVGPDEDTLFIDPDKICLLEMSQPDATCVVGLFDDSDLVGILRDEVTLAAYLAPLEPPSSSSVVNKSNGGGEQQQVVLLQRKVTVVVDDVDDVDGNQQQRRLQVEMVGVPRLLWYRTGWSCARIRVLLLQTVLAAQLIDPLVVHDMVNQLQQSPTLDMVTDEEKTAWINQLSLLEEAASLMMRAPTSSSVKVQMALSGHLPVRLVNKEGDGLPSSVMGASSVVNGLLLSATGGLYPDGDDGSSVLGSTLPNDSSVPFLRWATSNGGHGGGGTYVPIVSVDWSGPWMQATRDGAMAVPQAFTRHASAIEAGITTLSPSLPLLKQPPAGGYAGMFARMGMPTVTLDQCLAEHIQSETLDGENARYCSGCKEHRSAAKTLHFWRARLPEVLVMSLKRFKQQGRSAYTGSSLQGKIETYVDFPIEGLDLAPYCCDSCTSASHKTKAKAMTSSGSSSSSQQTATEPETAANTSSDGENGSSSRTVDNGPSSSSSSFGDDDENPDRTLYDLFAVCNHFGRMGFGHYTAFARDWMDMYTPFSATTSSSMGSGGGVGGWYKYDDEDVTPVLNPEGEIKTPAAYILFYRRRPANPRAS